MPTTKQKQFVLCLKNDQCEDLVLRKVYQLLSDSKEEEKGDTHNRR